MAEDSPTITPFPPEMLQRFANAYSIDIEAPAGASGEPRRTAMWAVVDDATGAVYVRSVRGEHGRWFRRLRANPLAEAVVDGERASIRAVPATADEIGRATAAYRVKYASDQRVGSVLRPEVEGATLRLEPR